MSLCLINVTMHQYYNLKERPFDDRGQKAHLRHDMVMEEYEKAQLIIAVDARDNLYFKWFSQKFAEWWCYKVLFSKSYPIFLVLMIVFFTLLRKVANLGEIFAVMAWIFAAILGLSFLFAHNIQICKQIVKTFDFWYKSINMVNVLVSQFILYHDLGTSDVTNTFASFGILCIVIPVLMADAAFVQTKTKVILSLFAIITCLFFAVYQYIIGIDVQYNPLKPFGLKNSIISFKYVLISGLLNIALFSIKPLIALFTFKCAIKSCKCHIKLRDANTVQNKLDDNDFHPNAMKSKDWIVRSITISKKPYFKWHNVSQENVLSTVVSS